MIMTDLVIDTRLLVETVRELDADIRGAIGNLDAALMCIALIDDALRDLATSKRLLENRLGAAMSVKRLIVPGVGTFERHPYRPGRHRCIDEEGLWRAVLDTRVVTGDGEILPPPEVIVRAYGAESRTT